MDKPERVPTIKEVEKNWDDMTRIYPIFDSAPQAFYFGIVSILEMSTAKNVLQVGCGRCLLVPYTLMNLSSNATYLATDLSPKMVQLAENRMKSTLQRFSCSLSYEEWCKKNHFTLKVGNGEQIIEPNIKFDRIICNMVLMLTENAEKMLKSLYEQAEEGCLLGVSVWGRRQLNTIQQEIQRVIRQLKVEAPRSRSNFHLYNKVPELAQKQGWKLQATWEQVATFPYLSSKDVESYAKQMSNQPYLSEQQRKWVYEQYMRRQKQRLDSKKQALLFPAQICIFRK